MANKYCLFLCCCCLTGRRDLQLCCVVVAWPGYLSACCPSLPGATVLVPSCLSCRSISLIYPFGMLAYVYVLFCEPPRSLPPFGDVLLCQRADETLESRPRDDRLPASIGHFTG